MIKIHSSPQGQYGDIAAATVLARSLKEIYPDSYIIQPINEKYKGIAPLFHEHPYIDDIHIYENYNNWPSANDKNWVLEQKFDILLNPMPRHKENNWWDYRHLSAEICYMNNIKIPTDLTLKFNQWFKINRNKKSVAITPFGGDGQCSKRIPIGVCNKIVKFLNKNGYRVFHIAVPGNPKLNNVVRIETNYFDAVKTILSTDFLITGDTGFNWVASGYNHPSFGIYFSDNGVIKKVDSLFPINTRGYIFKTNRNILLTKTEESLDSLFFKIDQFIKKVL